MHSCKEQYTLPTITMVGGGQKNLYFHIYDKKSGDLTHVGGCRAGFSIVNGVGRNEVDKLTTVIPTQELTIVPDEGINVMKLTLLPEHTANLCGKYIYQIWIIGADGVPEEPQQGELYVRRNNDPDYLKRGE